MVILTVRNDPCACYLARRLRDSGVEVALVSQVGLKIEADSPAYFKRLWQRSGARFCLDYLLLYFVKSTARAPFAVGARLAGTVGRGRKPGATTTTSVSRVYAPERAPALRHDPGLPREPWLTYLEIEDVNREPDLGRLRALEPDLLLLAGAPILGKRAIAIPRVACLNAHCGITPRYSGSSPFDWPIYERRFEDIGFTVHLVTPVVDAGPVVYQERIAWDPSRANGHLWPILAQRMYDKLADVALELIGGKRMTAAPQGTRRVMPPAGLLTRVLAELRRMRHARDVRALRPTPNRR